MATKTSVIVTDDLDGSDNASTFSFGYQGTAYEIDLGKKNSSKFSNAIRPYVEVARRVPSQRRTTRTSPANRGDHTDRAAVRAWAREQGLKVSERGRISGDIVARYEASH